MLKLVKYEWMSRWKFFLSGIVVGILLNIDIVWTIMNDNYHQKDPSIYFIVLWITAFAMGVALFVDHIGRIYNSLFTEKGYFLFTTPYSGYRILGEKITAVILECLGIISFGGILSFIDYQILSSKFVEMKIHGTIPADVLFDILKLLALMLLGYITILLTIYLAVTLVRSIFTSIKYRKTLSIVFVVIIAKIIGKMIDLFVQAVEGMNFYYQGMDAVPNQYFLLNLVIAAILFISTGYLLDRKVNL